MSLNPASLSTQGDGRDKATDLVRAMDMTCLSEAVGCSARSEMGEGRDDSEERRKRQREREREIQRGREREREREEIKKEKKTRRRRKRT